MRFVVVNFIWNVLTESCCGKKRFLLLFVLWLGSRIIADGLRFVFSPDIILCGWLGSKHRLINQLTGSDPRYVLYQRWARSNKFCTGLLFLILRSMKVAFCAWDRDINHVPETVNKIHMSSLNTEVLFTTLLLVHEGVENIFFQMQLWVCYCR